MDTSCSCADAGNSDALTNNNRQAGLILTETPLRRTRGPIFVIVRVGRCQCDAHESLRRTLLSRVSFVPFVVNGFLESQRRTARRAIGRKNQLRGTATRKTDQRTLTSIDLSGTGNQTRTQRERRPWNRPVMPADTALIARRRRRGGGIGRTRIMTSSRMARRRRRHGRQLRTRSRCRESGKQQDRKQR